MYKTPYRVTSVLHTLSVKNSTVKIFVTGKISSLLTDEFLTDMVYIYFVYKYRENKQYFTIN